MAKSLSLADAFQQLAKVKDVDSAAKYAAAASLSRALDEEKNRPCEDHADHADQRVEYHDERKKVSQCPQNLGEGLDVVVEATAPPDNSFQEKSPTREPSTSPVTESTVTFENKSYKALNKVETLHHERATKPTAASVMENQKENPRTAKVSFEAPREVVFLGEPEPEILLDREGDEFGDDFDRARCEDSAESREPKEEHSPEPTTFKMLEDLLDDIEIWKPKSLHLNVNDGEIQQRRRYLEQQRDRILAHKKC